MKETIGIDITAHDNLLYLIQFIIASLKCNTKLYLHAFILDRTKNIPYFII